MTYLDSGFNGWIGQRGKLRPVPTGMHMIDRRDGEHIRISTPEGRRSALGVSIDREASRSARAAAKRLCRIAHQYGAGIIASIDGEHIECWPSDRPTALNRAILGETAHAT